MTDQVLTTEDIADVWNGMPDDLRHKIVPETVSMFARRVETAVLAKVPSCVCRGMGIGTITEREARKRERAAWDAAWYTQKTVGAWDEGRVHHRDVQYPLPTKRVHRTVVLSDGTTIKTAIRADEKGKTVFDVTWRAFDGSGRCSTSNEPFYLAKAPADARLLADLVENPYTEEPDDA